MVKRRLAGFFFFLLSLFLLSSGSKKEEIILFKNVRIFDGEYVLAENTLIVKNGTIVKIGGIDKYTSGTTEIDGTGCTLLPGLIDSHVHVWSADKLMQSLIFGVTTVLDMFTDYHFAVEMKKQQATGNVPNRADMFSAGILATASGGHGTEYGIKIPTINSPDEAQKFVDSRIAEGSDYIKIIYDDGRLYNINIPTISKETMQALIEASHKRKKLAVVHISSLKDAYYAVQYGADCLAHAFIDRPPDEEFMKLVKKRNFFLIPTLTVLENICGRFNPGSFINDEFFSPYLTDTDISVIKKRFSFSSDSLNYSAAEECTRRLKEVGIPILAGSDAPNPGTFYGISLHRELELLVMAGLTPTEALKAASSAPAKAFNLTDRGTIAVGKRADLVLVKGNPTIDIKATRNIIGVWKQGVRVEREAYMVSKGKQRNDSLLKAIDLLPEGAEAGIISDFEANSPVSKFGYGWEISTDSITGGRSNAKYRITSDGANDSKGSLLVTGEIISGANPPWAGIMFYPGNAPMHGTDLSNFKEIGFWTKGDSKTYYIIVYLQSHGYKPAYQAFIAGSEWKKYSFKISSFYGSDGSDIMAIGFTAFMQPGRFCFQIDDFELK